MARLTPFADDSGALTVGDLTVENGLARVSFSGASDITRDRQGLAQAQAIKAVLDAVVQVLAADPDLPEAVPIQFAKHGTRKNPFV